MSKKQLKTETENVIAPTTLLNYWKQSNYMSDVIQKIFVDLMVLMYVNPNDIDEAVEKYRSLLEHNTDDAPEEEGKL